MNQLPAIGKKVFLTLVPYHGLGPFSGRSVAILLCLTYLLFDPIQLNADIVSASLTFGLLAVFIITSITVIVHGNLLKRSLTLSLHQPNTPSFSGTPVRIVVRLPSIRILPGCLLDLSLESEHPGATFPTLRLTGCSKSEHCVHADVTFPHRGNWDITGVTCKLVDSLGLVCSSWRVPQTLSMHVAPQTIEETAFPIISSSQRAGDLALDTHNRHGDPFDIKPYHPSDGVKKIVWKAFAKRGELLARHPEASMTPEGLVMIVVIAEPSDDQICSHALAYVRHLESMSLDLVVGCLGRGSRPTAHTAEATEALLISSVWDSAPLSTVRLKQELTNLLDEIRARSSGSTISKLLLFCSGQQAATPALSAVLSEAGSALYAQGIAPVFCLAATDSLILNTSDNNASTTLVRALTAREGSTDRPLQSSASYHTFLAECLRKQWEVLV